MTIRADALSAVCACVPGTTMTCINIQATVAIVPSTQ